MWFTDNVPHCQTVKTITRNSNQQTQKSVSSKNKVRIHSQSMDLQVTCTTLSPWAEKYRSEGARRSVVSDSVTPWTTAHQTPLSLGFSRPDCWRGLPFPSPGDLSDPGVEPGPPMSPADSLPSKLPEKPWLWTELRIKGDCVCLEPRNGLHQALWFP